MSEWFQLQKKLVPDLFNILERRYKILKTIDQFQPIGRRALAEHLHLTERQIRGEIEFLDEQSLIEITNKGVLLSYSGKKIIHTYPNMIRDMANISTLERRIQHFLHVKHVHVVPGNSDHSEDVKRALGEKASSILMNRLTNKSVITVTGGSTVATVAQYLKPVAGSSPLFVPARGGLGKNYEYQASSICVKMANQTNGEYRLLHIPDTVSAQSYETMKKEPEVKEVIDLINQADIVVHGVGDAMKMAIRRKTPEAIMSTLKKNNCVGEAFGYYFDDQGKTIHKVNSIGMQREQLLQVDCVITVAGGESKGEALSAFFKWGKSDVLITDEAAAKKLLSNIEQ